MKNILGIVNVKLAFLLNSSKNIQSPNSSNSGHDQIVYQVEGINSLNHDEDQLIFLVVEDRPNNVEKNQESYQHQNQPLEFLYSFEIGFVHVCAFNFKLYQRILFQL